MKTFLSVIFLSIMIACGGGGGGSSTPAPAPKHFVTNATFKGIFKKNTVTTPGLAEQQVNSSTGNMTTPRSDACVPVLLNDGRVLIAGGFSPDNSVMFNWEPVTYSAEVYDPSTGVFTAVGSMETPRYETNPVKLPDGRVVFFGGTIDTTSIEIFDPTTNLFTKVGDLVQGCTNYGSATYINGKILLFGFAGNGGYTDLGNFNPEVVDTTDWSSRVISNDSTFSIMGCQSQVYNGKVLIFGGVYLYNNNRNVLDTIYSYDPTNDSITLIGHMVDHRGFFSVVNTLDGKYIISGGIGVTDSAFPYDVEEYDPISNSSQVIGQIAYPEAQISSFVLQNQQIVNIGGYNTGNVSSNRQVIFDPSTQSSGLTGSMILPRNEFSAISLPNGLVLVTGGMNQDNPTFPWTNSAELFDPQLTLYIQAPTNTMKVGTSMDLTVVGSNYTLSCDIGSLNDSTYTAPASINSSTVTATITVTSNSDGSKEVYPITITQ